MWNWNLAKSVFLWLVMVGFLGFFAGLSPRATLVISTGMILLIHWLIEEINLIRNAHGSDIEEIESKVEDLEDKLDKLGKKKKS